jgi:electron transport complex protein RnfD
MNNGQNMGTEQKTEPLLPEVSKLIVSPSPHFHDGGSVRKIMLTVIVALLPACAASVYFFGWNALRVMLLCPVFCVGFEILWCKLLGKEQTWKDMSALLTGIILAMNLNAGIQWWICLVGSFMAIILAKQLYGGLGYNPFNPAAVARVGLLIGFTGPMTTNWMKPDPGNFLASDAVTTATPLTLCKSAGAQIGAGVENFADMANAQRYWDYFTGNMGGSLGETSALALLAGGIFLICLRIIKWQIPLAFIGTVILFTGIVHFLHPEFTPSPVFHILTGGVFIGAFFMATDMVTSPMTKSGALIFGAGCGIITCLIRLWGSFPEGVSFAILIMNALTPLIDRFTISLPFGFKVQSKKAEAT